MSTPSFEEFYALRRDRVGRALALTFGDSQLGAEAVDEAMARAFQRWSQVSTMSNPAGWVYRVGANWASSALRRLRRGRGSPPRETALEPPTADPSIDRAMALLSDVNRRVAVCRLLLGWSEEQTATALGIPAGTVKSRLARATQQLATSLAHLDPRHDRTETRT